MNTHNSDPSSASIDRETSPVLPEEYTQLYTDLVAWCRTKNVQLQPYNEPQPEGDPNVEHYTLPITSEQAVSLFQVPRDITNHNPRNFSIELFTPRRFEETNDLHPSIFVQYDFGPEDNTVGAYYLIDDTSGTYNQEELYDGEDWIEDIGREMDRRDFNKVRTIIAAAQDEHDKRTV